MPLDQTAGAPILVLKPGDHAGEVLASQEGASSGAVAFTLRLGADTPSMRSQALLPVKLVEHHGDAFDLVLGH